MRARPLLIAALCACLLAGCGKDDSTGSQPVFGIGGGEKKAAEGLGFPTFATKNTTRVGGADAVADAAAVARAVYPATTADTRPDAVTLVDDRDWRIAVAASVLMSRPVRAPMLFTDGKDLPAASRGGARRPRPARRALAAGRAGHPRRRRRPARRPEDARPRGRRPVHAGRRDRRAS